ncbi:E3 ubiquitin ligase TRIM40-like isoform X1 [Haliotis rubra]|uniref:E3 ubiquitin ligase TRIM40-like isoform X1 n=1 Tax=Haliotis rubra TaxID=36100 RepID=UPI001EE5A03F|nr:E3 ubiquitin ligase TRIM40-like isoform X1 [Haliotis rubra]XP_046548312.1 E3 ubiquitin ligase TRIM40-like isoform X1 [Haliotis rubra]XP_046548314.1 E3 ubiquitin ligase TRIM40-like isoform X1 [Haliotis rubra]
MAHSGVAQEDLQCPICTEFFDKPKLLPCGHRICSACLNNYVQSLNMQGCTCPLCKKPFTGNQELPIDHILQDLIKGRKSLSYDKCQVHGLHQSRYCCTCSMPACAECVIETHRHCKQVMPMERALSSMEAHMRRVSKELDKIIVDIKSSENMASSKMKDLLQENAEAVEQLEKVKVDFMTHMTNMQASLNQANQCNVTQLQEYIGRLKLLVSKAEEMNSDLKASLKSGSSERISRSIVTLEGKQGFLRTIPQRLKEKLKLKRQLTEMPSVEMGHTTFRNENFQTVKSNTCLTYSIFIVKLFIILIYLLVFAMIVVISYDRFTNCYEFYHAPNWNTYGLCRFIYSA